MLYRIDYDLKAKPESVYAELTTWLRKIGARRILQSSWLLASPASALDIAGAVERLLHPDDRVMVQEVTRNSSWNRLQLADDEVRAWLAHAS